MVKQFSAAHDVIMAVDFHGHSRKKNVFMYGCCDKEPTRVGQIRGKWWHRQLNNNWLVLLAVCAEQLWSGRSTDA